MVATLCNFFVGGMRDGVKDVKRKALEEMLTDTHETKWEREFRVFFDGTKPIGLGFHRDESSAGRRASMKMGWSCQYECAIKDIADVGLAREYNDKCLDIGDYNRIIVENLRVRKINHEDLDGVPYSEVMKKMHAAKPAFFLTFADINSRPTMAATENMASNPGNMVSIDPSRRGSSVGMNGSSSRSSIIRHRQSTIGTAAGMGKRLSAPAAASTTQDMNQNLLKQLEALKEQNLLLKQENKEIIHERDTLKAQAKANGQSVSSSSSSSSSSSALESNSFQVLNEQLYKALEEEYIHRIHALEQEMETIKKELLDARKSSRQDSNDKENLLIQLENAQAQAKEIKVLYEEKETLVKTLEMALNDLKIQHNELFKQMQEIQDQLMEAQTKAHEAQTKVEIFEAQKQKEKQIFDDLMKKELPVDQKDGDTIGNDEEEKEKEKEQQEEEEEALSSSGGSNTTTMTMTSITSTTSSVLDRILNKEKHQMSMKNSIDGLLSSSSHGEIIHEDYLLLIERLRQEMEFLEKQRDELTLEISCHEQHTHFLEEENIALKNQIQNLIQVQQHHSLEQEQNHSLEQEQDHSMKQEKDHSLEQEEHLSLQMKFLEKTLEEEHLKKEKLQEKLDEIEKKTKIHLEIFEKEKFFLQEFKKKLSKGILITKYGRTRSQVQKRVLYCDPECTWISWLSPTTTGENKYSQKNAKAQIQNLADVLPGATTETFQKSKQPPENPHHCLSLVFVQPCRTLDIETKKMDQRNELLRGFQLLHEEVSKKRSRYDEHRYIL